MNLEERKKEIEWYDNPTLITNLIIGLIALIIILSQSFAINSNLSALNMFRNIFNHNSIYLIVLVYFVFLKTSFGKRYFDFLSIFLIVLYFITFITSILTVFQSFSLLTILSLAVHAIVFVYLFHTFLRSTRFWKEFKLGSSPFNELSNEWFFYAIVVVSVVLLAINLISMTTFDGTVLALLDSIYIILFSRYIYLYQNHLNMKKMNCDNPGNFDEYKEKVEEVIQQVQSVSIQEVVVSDKKVISEVSSTKSNSSSRKKKATKKEEK